MYSQYYYNNNNNTTIPTHSRSSYNLQQYGQPSQTSGPSHPSQAQPQLATSSRSLSHSNLRAYYTSQQQQLNATTSQAQLQQNSISNPCINMHGNTNTSTSGIVLQNLQSYNTSQQLQVKSICDTTMNANLIQFAKYSSLQLQQVLSQYPQWLQKEYMRRLQRQYEELYVVEDPKIHHWSAICPRTCQNDENVSNNMQILSDNENDNYLSESATLSPSPIYNRHDIEDTPPHTHVNQNSNKLLTCIQILDYIKVNGAEDKGKEEDASVNNKFEIIEDIEEEEEEVVSGCDGGVVTYDEIESDDVYDNADNVQSPKEQYDNTIKEQVNGYYGSNNVTQQTAQQTAQQQQTNSNMSQQQYQQAVNRYYQQKAQAQAYQRQLLLQQQAAMQQQQQQQQQHVRPISHQQSALQHQTYLMQQNKYVAQYVRHQSQNNNPIYYQNTNYNYCA